MGGLKGLVNELWLRQPQWVHSVPATYAAGAHDIFDIVGGPVWITALLEYNDTAIGGATTTTIAVGAVGLDAGAVAIGAAAIDTLVVSPLDAAVAKIAPALAVQMPSLLGFATNIGVVASPGVAINVTFAGAAMGAAENVSYYVCYQKLLPQSLITLA
jgi:hypothetical protein